MIIIILFAVEIAKAIALGFIGFIVSYLILSVSRKASNRKSVSITVWVLSSIVAFAYPFYSLKQGFEKWAKAEESFCDEYVNYWVADDLPRELVAIKGSDKSKYRRGDSSRSSWVDRLLVWKVDSFAVYAPSWEESPMTAREPLDGVDSRWKKLWLAKTGDPRCKFYENYIKSRGDGYYQPYLERLDKAGKSDKCMAIEVVEDESAINYIDKKTVEKPLYSKPGFYSGYSKTRVFNDYTGVEYAFLTRLESGWPMFPNNFHSLFVSKGGKCEKLEYLIKKGIGQQYFHQYIFSIDF